MIKVTFLKDGRCGFFDPSYKTRENSVRCYKNPLWGFIVSIFIKTVKIHYDINSETKKTLYLNQESFRDYAKQAEESKRIPEEIMNKTKRIHTKTAELFLKEYGIRITPRIQPDFFYSQKNL